MIKNRLRKFMTSKPDAQKILDRIVSSEGKSKHNKDVMGINKPY